MINATVSHELRNPLNSLIGQICSMEDNFSKFTQMILCVKDQETKDSLTEINSGLKLSGTKMISAVKFIDFFVHDILDYTLLNKEDRNFIKDLCIFDINIAIAEIVSILEDKASMKNITVETILHGFENDFVKTDAKRL